MKRVVKLNVNGLTHEVTVEPHQSLLEVLRDQLEYTGVKKGCDGTGECGACTVLMDGRAVYSCLMLAADAEGATIVTIEGLAKGDKLHPLQEAFLNHGAFQCGFCTPGLIMSAKALLDENPNPTEEDVKEAIKGNLCRCGNYIKIVEAILDTSKKTG